MADISAETKCAALRQFAERLRVAMAVSDVSRADIARACDVSPQSVHKWCRGICAPRSSELMTIARTTGATLDFLMRQEPVDIRWRHPKHQEADHG